MNQLNKLIRSLPIGYFLFLMMGLLIISCQEDDPDIQQNFPFEVRVMPIPGELGLNETAEIRVSILTKGNFSGTQYAIRYFQFEGKGDLQCGGEPAYLPNDLYYLLKKDFRLNYTSKSEESHRFSIWISDNFGNEKQIDFEFEYSD
ncbi:MULTISPECIES: TraQ conjugal transfer family protein [Chryseobacterium]|uniref:TraQ conjugal transfer family protein n=1 Tax=Chryseobacterium TaxID=59732 RepID=UPI0016285C2D|nr:MULTISPECIES: TraQ conjugal transfer family protein [Chryseobacterium]MBF6643947.1 DUF3872 domain-containing protein [Chryseobacterium indologenes]MBU3046813.1 DUF3872 domain-containing protein [Chryseobacterium indologenes]QQQ72326.1 DUF3872 domain-containing protein [Chryseobacterium indologenes]